MSPTPPLIVLAKGAGIWPVPQAVHMASYGTGVLSHRHHPRLPGAAAAGGALRPARKRWRCSSRAHVRHHHRAELRLGVLSSPARAGTADLSWRCCSSSASRRRQLRDVLACGCRNSSATEIRATAFAFCTSVGRFIGAGVNFALGAAVHGMGTLGTPVAWTAVAFGIGLIVIPFAVETRGEVLPR